MVSIKAIQQDARRVLGNRMDIRGKFGEYRRLRKRLTSGDLAQREANREAQQFVDIGDELSMLLRDHGLRGAALALEDDMNDTLSSATPRPNFESDYGEFGPI